MDGNVDDRVECYSGFEYPERPTAFTWQGERLTVTKINESSLTPEGKTFRVTTENGQRFTLKFDQQADCWSIIPE